MYSSRAQYESGKSRRKCRIDGTTEFGYVAWAFTGRAAVIAMLPGHRPIGFRAD